MWGPLRQRDTVVGEHNIPTPTPNFNPSHNQTGVCWKQRDFTPAWSVDHTYSYKHTLAYAHTHTHKYAYTHAHTHTNTHAHTYFKPWASTNTQKSSWQTPNCLEATALSLPFIAAFAQAAWLVLFNPSAFRTLPFFSSRCGLPICRHLAPAPSPRQNTSDPILPLTGRSRLHGGDGDLFFLVAGFALV